MHAVKLNGALGLLLVVLLFGGHSVKAEEQGISGDAQKKQYQNCPDCTLSCDIKVTLGEEKNRYLCYGILGHIIAVRGDPKSLGFTWGDKGASDMAGTAWHHDRECSLEGVTTQNGIFDHTVTEKGMTAKIVCGGCS